MVIGSAAAVQGVIYFGSTDGNLYAIDSESGKQKWKFQAKSRVPSSPAVSNGTVYFTAYDGNLYAVDASTGGLKWKFRRVENDGSGGTCMGCSHLPRPCRIHSTASLVAGGLEWSGLFGSGDGNVYSLNAEYGAVSWKFKTGDVVHASPALADGTVFIGSGDAISTPSMRRAGRRNGGSRPVKIRTYITR